MMIEGLATAYYNRGISLAMEGRITQAIEELEKAVAIEPGDWKALNVLGLCQYQMGEFLGAKGAWEESLEQYSEGNPAKEYLRVLGSRRFDRFTRDYNEALELAKKEDYRGALEILQPWEGWEFNFIPMLNLIGLCLYGTRKYGMALSYWRATLEIDKDNQDARDYIDQTMGKHILRISLWTLWQNLKSPFSPPTGGNKKQ